MMKYFLISAFILSGFTVGWTNGITFNSAGAQTAKNQNKKKKKTTSSAKSANQRVSQKSQPGRPSSKAVSSPLTSSGSSQLSQALTMVRAGNYQQALPLLYNLSKKPEFAAERMQIKFIMGSALMELKLYQTAAFQFVEVIRNGSSKYVTPSIQKLSMAADALGDDSQLNYAINRVRLDEFPELNRDIIYFRLGEIRLKNRQFDSAADLFSRVPASSRLAIQARFNKGLAFLEANKASQALPIFQNLVSSRNGMSVVDPIRVASQLALARTYYQMQDWDNAINIYRTIPRDTESWHDALFESSWAYLRSARFRSALSNFQSLHSQYYEDFYLPESLLLRGIVYLYICKYDEMEKVLNLFEKTYNPVRNSIGRMLDSTKDPMAYYAEVEKAYNYKRNRTPVKEGLHLPYKVLHNNLSEGDIQRAFGYMGALFDEKARLEKIPALARSSMGNYANKIINNRIRNTKAYIGDHVRAHLVNMKAELKDLYEQAAFIRYEMINGRKEQLKKKIAGKDIPKTIEEDVDRKYYVQNGYEYWPFDGEYWLDEIGNYHYLGKQSCE